MRAAARHVYLNLKSCVHAQLCAVACFACCGMHAAHKNKNLSERLLPSPTVCRSWFTVAERKRAQSLPDCIQLAGTPLAQGRQVGECVRVQVGAELLGGELW